MKKIYVFLAVALMPMAAFAQGGSAALPFTRIFSGATMEGTAGAAMASAEISAWGSMGSAAMLPFSGKFLDVEAEYRYAGTGRAAAAVSLKPLDNMAFALGMTYASGASINGYQTANMVLSAGGGMMVAENITIGINARYARQNLTEDVSYGGFSVDVSAAARFGDLTATAGVSTLGSKVTSSSGDSYSQPSYAYLAGEYAFGAFRFDAAAECAFSGAAALSIGAVYSYDGLFFARTGYRLASASSVLPSQFAIGAGINFHGAALDLTYLRLPSANVVAVNLGYSF